MLPSETGVNPSYRSDLCECMDQYSLGDANLDYTVSYLWTPEPFVTPNFAANVYSSWPLIHGLGIRYDVDAIQDFYFNECTIYASPETFEDCVEYNLGLSGQDWTFNEEFWNDPNLTFPPQNLPSYQDFYDAFPKNEDGSWMYGADNIYNLVGGDVLQAREDYPVRTNNTCALKVSIALNGAGIDIPNLPGQTLQGEDGSYYFLNARALAEWMKKTFTDYEEYNSTEYNNPDIHTLLNGQTGIIISIYESGEASGHADIYTGSGCASNSNCAVGGTVYWWSLN
jgi:hypothetical protein